METVEQRKKLDDLSKIVVRFGIGLLSIAASVAVLLFNETRNDVKELLINQSRFDQKMINVDGALIRQDREIEKIQVRLDKITGQ